MARAQLLQACIIIIMKECTIKLTSYSQSLIASLESIGYKAKMRAVGIKNRQNAFLYTLAFHSYISL